MLNKNKEKSCFEFCRTNAESILVVAHSRSLSQTLRGSYGLLPYAFEERECAEKTRWPAKFGLSDFIPRFVV
jgi:hypothetical protein